MWSLPLTLIYFILCSSFGGLIAIYSPTTHNSQLGDFNVPSSSTNKSSPSGNLCPHGFLGCRDGKCTSKSFVCDGSPDCDEGEDELLTVCDYADNMSPACSSDEYPCQNATFCIDAKKRCNSQYECPNHDDELGCKAVSCINGFRCKDNTCKPKSVHCDGKSDCFDGSDEVGCDALAGKMCSDKEHFYQCHHSSICIDIKALCDNNTDCPNKDDEGGHCFLDDCKQAKCEHNCQQTPHGAQCYCPSGYKLNSNNRSCDDIDECSQQPPPCYHECVNTPGHYVCHCKPGFYLEKNGVCKPESHEALAVYTVNTEIRGYYFGSKRLIQIANFSNLDGCSIQSFDMNSVERKLYYIEKCRSSKRVYSTSINPNSQVQNVVMSGLKSPQDIAVDSVAGNIYITDLDLKSIIVCQESGIHCTVVVRHGIEKIKSIVLYQEQGKMYWSDFGGKANIYEADMDGSNIEMLIKNDTVHASGLAIDRELDRLYWASVKDNKIEYWDFVTAKRVFFYHSPSLSPEWLGVFETNIYFTSHRGTYISAIDKLKSNGTVNILHSSQMVSSFRLFHPLIFPKRDSPCWDGLCSHICLLKRDSYVCACPGHLELDYTGKLCQPKDKDPFLLVAAGKTISRVYFESIGRDVLVPIWSVSAPGTLGCITYDWNANRIFVYIYDKSEIVSIQPRELHGDVIVDTVYVLHNQTVQGLTYDSFTDNLYWVDHNNGLLEIGTANGHSRTTLLSDLERPSNLVLHQEMNKIYIANLGSDPHILQTELDGSKHVKLISLPGSLPTSLFLCKRRKQLYWSDATKGLIEKIDLVGGDLNRQILLTKAGPVMSIVVHNDTYYWTKMDSGDLWYTRRTVADASSIDLKIQDGVSLTKYIVYANDEKMKSQCLRDNGGCSHICLVVEGNVKCLCPPKHRLIDNFKCELEHQCHKPSFSCDNNRQCLFHEFVCDGHEDCVDKSDEENCKDFCAATEFRCHDGSCIPRAWLCDAAHDCKDHSDEINCTTVAKCDSIYFQCPDGKCLDKSWVCDGLADCKDGRDEKNCTSKNCTKFEFQCISDGKCITANWRCDGEGDCADKSDELDCPSVACREDQFKCDMGACIDSRMHCDRMFDCSDESDEKGCDYKPATCPPHLISCSDGHCIYPTERCDGYSDCNNKEDEEGCQEKIDCPADQVRCDSPNSTVNCIPHKWLCDNANDCGDWWDERSPQCTAPAPETTTGKPCRDGSFPCKSGDCIDYVKVCDRVPNCLDQSDEGGHCDLACSYNKGDCSHICHSSPYGAVCDCPVGWQLKPDGKTCEDINECTQVGYCSQYCENYDGGVKCTCEEGYYPVSEGHKCKANGSEASLLYMLPNAIKSIGLHTQTEHSIVRIGSLTMKGMDYDYASRTVFWTDAEQGTINGVHYGGGHSSYKIVENLEKPSHLSWDYIGRNFYFVQADSSIAVCNENGSLCGLVLTTGLNKIDSFVVSPRHRVMFWAAWSSSQSTSDGRIERCGMNGKKRKIIISNNLNSPSGLTIDPVLDKIYWVDTKQEDLYVSNFQGKNLHKILDYSLLKPLSIAVFEDYIYWANTGADNLMKCNKFTGGARLTVHQGNIKAHAMKIFHEVVQRQAPNPCEKSNCAHLCLISETNYTCTCAFKFRLHEDNRTCLPERLPPSEKIYNKVCDSKPCRNGGTCVVHNLIDWSCECPPNYVGHHCELKITSTSLRSKSYLWFILLLIFLIIILVAAFFVYRATRQFGGSIFKRHNSKKVAVSFKNPAFDANHNKSGYIDGLESEASEAMLPKSDKLDNGGQGFSNPLYGQYVDDSDQRVFIKV